MNGLDSETDIEVFRRWVEEAGLREAMKAAKVAMAADGCRMRLDELMVYGEENTY